MSDDKIGFVRVIGRAVRRVKDGLDSRPATGQQVELKITDEEDRIRPFYREITDSDWEKIKTMAGRLLTWTQWSSPQNSEIDSQLSTSKSVLKAWFKEKGLTTGYLMGASE